MRARRGYGFSLALSQSWSAWGSGVSVGLPHIESTGSLAARDGADASTLVQAENVEASAGAGRALANGRSHCQLVGLPAYALEGRLGSGTGNRPGPFSGCP